MIFKCLNNSKGSAAIFLISVLPLVFLICISFWFTTTFVQLKSRVRSTCYLESIQIQKEIIHYEQKLFALNPVSTALRLRMLAAIAMSVIPATAGVGLEQIAEVRRQQEQLDRLQKSIIQAALVQSQIKSGVLLQKIHSHIREMTPLLQIYLWINNVVYMTSRPTISVQPDFEDLAPNYGLRADYKSTQKLVLSWQYRFQTKQSAQQLLTSNNQFDFSCGAGPNKKGNQWSVEIKGDKF